MAARSRPASPHTVLADHDADQTPRWHPGERFHTVVLDTVDRLGDDADAVVAVDVDGADLTYRALDRWANRLARRLVAEGIGPGDRVGLLLDRSPHAYASMLAISLAGAAWVPLDAAFPAERIRYICGDAGVSVVLTRPHLAGLLDEVPVRASLVDDARDQSGERVPAVHDVDDALAYIVYTSGTTGRPKGVAIRHSAICNFIRVAAETYGYEIGDRVYQGLTIAFDFSVEEIWVPLAAGATLVPAPPGEALVGADLDAFLRAQDVSALCCVPTLLATLDPDPAALRLLIVSGEACPRALVDRWAREGRRLLNVYGPTETTVTATWSELRAGEPVTIGVPLPTYSVVVLDPESLEPVADGETGELAVGGIGLSPGYVGRDDLTARAFIEDRIGLPNNPGHRLYRTGDLVRIGDDGRILYRGRIDTQVKVRGYRIEVDEIESVLLADHRVAQAAVAVHRTDDGTVELAAYYTAQHDDVDRDGLLARVRRLLPAYMVPSYLERLPALPMLPSDKVDRNALPAPSGPRWTSGTASVPPEGPIETFLAEQVAAVLGLPAVSVEADLFDELGADSLRVARLCGAVRGSALVPVLTTRSVYERRTVRAIAEAAGATSRPAATAPPAQIPHRASRAAHLATGTAQGVILLLFPMLVGTGGWFAYEWLTELHWARELPRVAGRALVVGVATVAVVVLLPIALKWLLIGRSRTGPVRAWSLRYLRFWVVRVGLRFGPAVLLAGSPLYNGYLRALGARVGRHALVFATPPVFADLVEIGPAAVVREGAVIDAYRVEAGWVLPGRVVVGAAVDVGEGSVLDIDTRLGDGAELAHASALLQGGRVPAGRRWHGTPAVDAGAAAGRRAAVEVGTAVRALHSAGQIVAAVLLAGPGLVALIALAEVIGAANPVHALVIGALLVGATLVVRALVPRLASRLLVPGADHPLYGLRWSVFRFVVRAGNSRFFNELFGDSSAVLGYLRAIGYRFTNPVQTGSNFGTDQRQHVASLCTVGGGSLVSDGLLMPNGDFTAHSFRVREIRVGERVFMGNGVVYPPDAALGDDVLLATKVMVPVDGPMRSGVGLLGSPAFEIPRTVERDRAFDAAKRGDALRRGLAGKNRHNLATALLYLADRFLLAYLLVLAVALLAPTGPAWAAVSLVLGAFADLVVLVLVDWCSRGFRRLAPMTCSLYDRRFWRHERYWKLADPTVIAVFDGTPFKAALWRLLGVRVGRMLLDDGAFMPERSLVTLGDHVTLGARSVLHGHSLEDGTFKSDRIVLGSDVTIGTSALVHYGVEMADGAVLHADAYLMKGERPRRGSVWSGNPAGPLDVAAASGGHTVAPRVRGAAPSSRGDRAIPVTGRRTGS